MNSLMLSVSSLLIGSTEGDPATIQWVLIGAVTILWTLFTVTIKWSISKHDKQVEELKILTAALRQTIEEIKTKLAVGDTNQQYLNKNYDDINYKVTKTMKDCDAAHIKLRDIENGMVNRCEVNTKEFSRIEKILATVRERQHMHANNIMKVAARIAKLHGEQGYIELIEMPRVEE